MFKGTRVRVPARKIIMGFNITTEATGIRLSSFAVETSKSKPEQMEGGGKREKILVTRARSQFTPEFESFDQEAI